MNGSTMEWIKLETLGKGSCGVVSLVKPTNSVSDDQVFAVKSCRYENSSSLQKEPEIFNQFVGCANFVQCYCHMLSTDDDHGMRYHLFLEYAPAGSLLDLMTRKYGGKIPERDAKGYARMLLEGIRDIHQLGYVHCDLKPANILVFPPDQYGSINRLKIADFGRVKRQGERHMPEVEPCMARLPGTPVYMPPESFTDNKISAALDIWSLGCIVLEMITGKRAWKCRNWLDLVVKIGFLRYPPQIPESMSSTGKDFLMRCFKRDPSERWTAEMLLIHPFLHEDSANVDSHLLAMEQVDAMYLEFDAE